MKDSLLFFVCLLIFISNTTSQQIPGRYNPRGITAAGGYGSGTFGNQLTNPEGLYVDARGNMFIADHGNHRVQQWNNNASLGLTVAGGKGQGSAADQLAFPLDVYVDAAQNVYVADPINNRVQKWLPGASTGITVAGTNGSEGSGAAELSNPRGVFVDATGNLFVADHNNHRIQKWAPGASSGITVAGGNGAGSQANQFIFPTNVFVDAAGNLYVSDAGNRRVQKWAPGASSGVTVAGGNGTGSAANQIGYVSGIFVASNGDIYIPDQDNHRVQMWAAGALSGITVAGDNGQGSLPNQLNVPHDVFIIANGDMYVSDGFNHRIQKFELVKETDSSSTNTFTVAGGNGPGFATNQLFEPNNIVVDATGNIFIADLKNHRIQKWAPGAKEGTTVAGGAYGTGPAELSFPTDVRLDASGNLYISDEQNQRIQKWVPGAASGITVAGGNGRGSGANQLHDPAGCFIDAAGNIFIADYQNNRIQKWVPGALSGITVAGGNGAGSAANQIELPNDVFVDPAGNLYIADQNNHRIQKWAPGATSGITVAGGNGRGIEANQFNFPTGVFVDAAQNIYVADFFNHRIQKWAPGATSGITVAGGNGQGPAANQLDRPVNVFVDATGNIYVSDAFNDRIQKIQVFNPSANTCPPDLSVAAPSCNKKVTISWTAPADTFPASITTPEELDPAKGIFTFMGSISGHGYYRSTGKLQWQLAKDISKAIGATGHLATITSAEETNLIFNQIKNSGYSPWIGLYNTGKPGRFRWVNREPFNYANWAPGEPNNFGGNRRNITEPYVRMIDTSGAWNDQRDDYLPFIVEFEKPLIRNRQISGPRNGSNQKPGVYTVCYERRDFTTNRRDTCCFTVTVTCDSTLITQNTGTVSGNAPAAEKISKGLQVTTSPNPSSYTFRLNITSDNNEKVNLQVTDNLGRTVETRNSITPNQPLLIGSGYLPGIYFARVMQGSKITTIRLIKQAN